MRRAPIGLLVLLAAGCGGGSHVIPWTPERPVPEQRLLAPPCQSRNVKAWIGLQGAAGDLLGGITLTNVGSPPCALLGRPGLRLVGAGRELRARFAADPAAPDHLPFSMLRALRRYEQAWVTVFWGNWCEELPRAFLLTLPHSGGTLRVPVPGVPRCDGGPPYLSVGPFRPRPLPLFATILDARGRAKTAPDGSNRTVLRVRRGGVLHYEVALATASPVPFHFSPCPSYVEALAPGNLEGDLAPDEILSLAARRETHVLNCRSVGWLRLSQGAVFAMKLRIPATTPVGRRALVWELTHGDSANDAVRVIVTR